MQARIEFSSLAFKLSNCCGCLAQVRHERQDPPKTAVLPGFLRKECGDSWPVMWLPLWRSWLSKIGRGGPVANSCLLFVTKS